MNFVTNSANKIEAKINSGITTLQSNPESSSDHTSHSEIFGNGGCGGGNDNRGGSSTISNAHSSIPLTPVVASEGAPSLPSLSPSLHLVPSDSISTIVFEETRASTLPQFHHHHSLSPTSPAHLASRERNEPISFRSMAVNRSNPIGNYDGLIPENCQPLTGTQSLGRNFSEGGTEKENGRENF